MPRRSWRDLAPGPRSPGGADGAGSPPSAAPAGPELLRRAAAGDSHLASLLAERDQLEARLSGLIGPAGQPGAAPDPRFPVTGLRERRAEIASWAAARDAVRTGRSRAGRERTGLDGARPGAAARPLTEAGAGLRSQLFGPLRSGLDRYDQVRSALERSEEFLERPRQLADGLEQRWQRTEEQITAPLDRDGHYAAERERILDVITGGSGDLTARAEEARRRALERRSGQDREERRAARRHERHHEQRRAEQRETDRLDRRTSAGKGARP
ncbi:hypothetical protein CFK38_04135 [Brachybacterium vulturis]|uniref:Uncharacterized protein n=1 Tax=Brachybacterium vulturis TaxID=2017484 RepID=A0A291GLG8_9MICO|nr:hypothetical protein [Brachybacterium vulturis]ATG50804.1 hypothetical protein CFK38_04135 [Brachybacterium vulturis]